jgi:radical SAM superfamily enzyme YgiQ (UPF0313 family)
MTGDIISLYRGRLSAEKGTVRKNWGGRLSVALAYPNYYRLGMSNLGFQIVYDILNKRPDVVAERVFLPEGQEMSLYLRSGRALLSLETQTPVHKFDLVAFSLSFENDYPNILKILELARIPLFAEERSSAFPLVMAGGVTTFLNPEPLAPFVDLFLLGEAEANLGEFIDLFQEMTNKGVDKDETLETLSRSIHGLYVPAFYRPEYNNDGTLRAFFPIKDNIPEKIKVPRQDPLGEEVGHTVVTTSETEFSNKVLIEVGRGCGRSCRFCAAGYVYRPPRFHGESHLCCFVEDILEGCRQVGLLGTAVSDIPHIETLTSLIVGHGCGFSVSSLRADGLTPSLLRDLKQAGQRSLAIAPEAGSDRLRRVINKHLTTEQITDAVRLISKTHDFSLRLYFLIGLPTETSEDVNEIVNLVKVIKHHMVKESAPRGRIGRIRLSVSCFVPKPFTPFQWCAMEEVSSLKKKQKRLQKTLTKEGGIKVNVDLPKWAYIQTLISVGDRRVGSILFNCHKSGGDWTKALRISDLNPEFFVHRPKGLDERLPWDFIDHGIKKEHLKTEYNQSLKEQESEVCSVGKCYRCGVCHRPES